MDLEALLQSSMKNPTATGKNHRQGKLVCVQQESSDDHRGQTQKEGRPQRSYPTCGVTINPPTDGSHSKQLHHSSNTLVEANQRIGPGADWSDWALNVKGYLVEVKHKYRSCDDLLKDAQTER